MVFSFGIKIRSRVGRRCQNALDFNSLASNLTSRIVNFDAVKSATGDEGAFTFESTLEQANSLRVLQDIEIRERRRKGPVKPGFFGLQPFSNRGIQRD